MITQHSNEIEENDMVINSKFNSVCTIQVVGISEKENEIYSDLRENWFVNSGHDDRKKEHMLMPLLNILYSNALYLISDIIEPVHLISK